MDVPFVVSSDETPAELCDFDLVWQLGSYINAVVSMITTAYRTQKRTLDFSSSLACLRPRHPRCLHGRDWTTRRPTGHEKAGRQEGEQVVRSGHVRGLTPSKSPEILRSRWGFGMGYLSEGNDKKVCVLLLRTAHGRDEGWFLAGTVAEGGSE